MWRISNDVREYQRLENKTGMGAKFRTVTFFCLSQGEGWRQQVPPKRRHQITRRNVLEERKVHAVPVQVIA
jgi:hypothetical protein